MIAIIGAMEQEMSLLKSHLESSRQEKIAQFEMTLGRLAGQDVVLLQCGVGKVNAAVGCALLLDHYRPEAVFNTGSAGGMLPEQTFGDIVLSSDVLHHDADVTAFGYAPGQLPGMPARFKADVELLEKAEMGLSRLKVRGEIPASLGFSRGTIGSGDVFVHDSDLIAQIRKHFPDLCAVEMESAAIAQTCHLFRVPFVIIRALSDIAGKESPMKFDEFLPLASRRSAELILEILSHWKK